MGLLTFSGAQPTKAEIAVAKNYLDEKELKRLNTLVSAYFDAAEFRAQEHQATYMKDWLAHLDRLIVAMEAKTLDGAGTVEPRAGHRQSGTGVQEVPCAVGCGAFGRGEGLPGNAEKRPTQGRRREKEVSRFAPPLVITEEQLMECCRIIALSVRQFA